MRLNKKLIRIITLAYLLVVMGLTPTAIANAQLTTNSTAPSSLPQYNQGVDKTIAQYLCVPSKNNTGTALYDCLDRVYRFGIVAGSLALVFFIVWAGYSYMLGGETGKQKGKAIFTSALTGMVIILSSYVLLRFINPDLVKYKPIQPPIFTSAGLPACDKVGWTTNCIITTGPDAGQVHYGGGTNYSGGRCSPITNDASPASINNLTNSCFGKYGADVVKQASIVAGAESGGDPSLPVGAGSCGGGRTARCTGGEIPVWGLYQINITAHQVGGLNCPAAFGNRAWTCSTSCTVTNTSLYNQCVTAAKNAANNINVACTLYARNIAAGRPGFNDWGNRANEHGNRCGF